MRSFQSVVRFSGLVLLASPFTCLAQSSSFKCSAVYHQEPTFTIPSRVKNTISEKGFNALSQRAAHGTLAGSVRAKIAESFDYQATDVTYDFDKKTGTVTFQISEVRRERQPTFGLGYDAFRQGRLSETNPYGAEVLKTTIAVGPVSAESRAYLKALGYSDAVLDSIQYTSKVDLDQTGPSSPAEQMSEFLNADKKVVARVFPLSKDSEVPFVLCK